MSKKDPEFFDSGGEEKLPKYASIDEVARAQEHVIKSRRAEVVAGIRNAQRATKPKSLPGGLALTL